MRPIDTSLDELDVHDRRNPRFRTNAPQSDDARMESTRTTTIAVVVPVRNEERHIARTLDALMSQEYPPAAFEVIVVDGQSSDRTWQIAAEYAARFQNVRLFENPNRWSSAARNIGIRETSADVILIVDGHCELADRSHLARVADAFERSGADCLGRPQPLGIGGANHAQRAIALARGCWLGHHPDSYIFSSGEGLVPAHSVAAAYRRDVFDKIGMFDEEFDACEDVELNHRIDRRGLKCFWTDRIALHYVPRSTLRGLFRQMARYGRGRVRLARKHPELANIKSLAPALWLAGLILGALLAAVIPLVATAYFTGVALYFAIVAAVAVVVACRARQLHVAPLVAAAFVMIHAGAGWGSLFEWFFGGRKLRPPAATSSPCAETSQPAANRK